MAGLFVSFEGPEGAGKSTQLGRLAGRLEAAGYATRRLREPGGTALGEALRGLLLTRDGAPVDPHAEALLYGAARAQLVREIIRPALARGAVVLSDRYADSTLAYQGYGRGLPLDALRTLVAFAVDDAWPALVILLDLPVVVGLRRKAATEEWNRFEAEALAFHERVRAGYLALAVAEPTRWLVLDAQESPSVLEARIWDTVAARLPPLDAAPSCAL